MWFVANKTKGDGQVISQLFSTDANNTFLIRNWCHYTNLEFVCAFETLSAYNHMWGNVSENRMLEITEDPMFNDNLNEGVDSDDNALSTDAKS